MRCGWRATSRPTATRSSTPSEPVRRPPSGCVSTGWRGWRAATRGARSSTATWPRRPWRSTGQLALLAVLLLRGPQTPGELKARTERMAQSDSPGRRRAVLAALIERGYARGSSAVRDRRRIGMPSCWGAESPAADGFSGVGLTASRDFAQSPSDERGEGQSPEPHGRRRTVRRHQPRRPLRKCRRWTHGSPRSRPIWRRCASSWPICSAEVRFVQNV